MLGRTWRGIGKIVSAGKFLSEEPCHVVKRLEPDFGLGFEDDRVAVFLDDHLVTLEAECLG